MGRRTCRAFRGRLINTATHGEMQLVDTRQLSRRSIQPGNVHRYRPSELAFLTVLWRFHEKRGLTVDPKPEPEDTRDAIESRLRELKGRPEREELLEDGKKLRIPKSRRLKHFYLLPNEIHKRGLGLEPEGEICHSNSGRFLLFEVKNQGAEGNAEERCYRHHTEVFSRHLKDRFSLGYHPYFTIFTGALSTHTRYTLKFPYHIAAGHYFLWTDYLSNEGRDRLYEYLAGLIDRYLVQK